MSASLTCKIADTPEEVAAALDLRRRVFRPNTPDATDEDAFDAHCQHLVVKDGAQVVGYYRLILNAPYYSATMFELGTFVGRRLREGNLLEVGRLLVDPEYQGNPAIMIKLWGGLRDVMLRENVKTFFGCSSLPGSNPAAHDDVLSYLRFNHLLPRELEVQSLKPYMRPGWLGSATRTYVLTHTRSIRRSLPSALGGYINLRGKVGHSVYADPDLNTTVLFTAVCLEDVPPRTWNHFMR